MEMFKAMTVRKKTYLELRHDTNFISYPFRIMVKFQYTSYFQEKLALLMTFYNLYLKPTQVG